jgi:glycosyltransferase involved in cell wall biosynthesis
MRNGKTISVVIPCYKEEEGIRIVMETMPDFVDEVIVVDNASTDATEQVAVGLGAKVIREARKSYGRAYKTGFRAAKGDVILLYFRHLRYCLCGMWVFKRSVLEKIDAHNDGMSFSEEIKLEAFCNKDLKCREVPIQFKYAIRAGEAKLSPWKDGFNGIAFFFGKRFDLGRHPGSILKQE